MRICFHKTQITTSWTHNLKAQYSSLNCLICQNTHVHTHANTKLPIHQVKIFCRSKQHSKMILTLVLNQTKSYMLFSTWQRINSTSGNWVTIQIYCKNCFIVTSCVTMVTIKTLPRPYFTN